MNNYTYYIDGVQVYPINDTSLKYKFLKVNNGIVLEKTLESSLVFNYDNGAFNFKDQEAINKCDDLPLTINQVCSGEELLWYEGIFALAEGEFDDNKCTYTVKPRQKKYTLNDTEVNILYAEGKQAVVNVAPFRTYVNGRKFEDVLLWVAKQSNPNINSVISNLFQINPDGPFYLPITNYWTQMVFFALSDIQEPVPSNLATKALITFKKLMDDLNTLFDVEWYLDDNYNLRIEHVSFFDGVLGIDLTQPQYLKYLKGTDKYTYNLDDFVKNEEWQIQGHTQQTKVKYGALANVAKKENSKVNSTTTINTDYWNIIQYSGGDSIAGLFLFATYNYFGFRAHIDESITLDLYGAMGPHYLVTKFHTYKRPDLYGIITSNQITLRPRGYQKSGGIIFDSTAPIKKQTEITFPLCCGQEFDLKNKIKTQMGEGFLQEGELDTKTSLLKTTLQFEVENCNEFLPSDLEGLDLWLQFNDFIKVGTAISQWNDSSGNNRHAVQLLPAAKPSYLSGYAVFNNNDYMTTPAFQLFPAKRGTVFVLWTGGTGPGAVLSTNNGGAGQYWDLSVNLDEQLISVNEGITLPQNDQAVLLGYDNAGLFTINRNENTRERTTHNSVANPNGNNPATIPNNQPSSEPLIIGQNLNVISPSFGDFVAAEIIIFGRSLTDAEMEKIEFYLVKKGIYQIY